MNEQLVKDLQALYDFFAKPGVWIQGSYSSEGAAGDVCFCFSGGIHHVVDVTGEPKDWYDRVLDVRRAICDQLPEVEYEGSVWKAGEFGEGHIIAWNDTPIRKQDDLLVITQKALDAAKAQA